MKPSKKSEEMESLCDSFLPGKGRICSIRSNICSWCGSPIDVFRDALSKKEYTISGFCQKCQDDTFGK